MSLETTLQNQRKEKPGIVKGIIIPIAAACSLGLAALSMHPAINPTVSEIVVGEKLKEDYNIALENYSREAYFSGQDKDFSGLNLQRGEIPGMINGRYVAFSANVVSARYLDKKEDVSDNELFDFVKAYSQDYSSKH